MASYKERKAEPLEIMPLEGYTVDYCEPQPGMIAFLTHPFANMTDLGA